jgi:hypothetical protein
VVSLHCTGLRRDSRSGQNVIRSFHDSKDAESGLLRFDAALQVVPNPDDWDYMFLRNAGNHLQDYTEIHNLHFLYSSIKDPNWVAAKRDVTMSCPTYTTLAREARRWIVQLQVRCIRPAQCPTSPTSVGHDGSTDPIL